MNLKKHKHKIPLKTRIFTYGVTATLLTIIVLSLLWKLRHDETELKQIKLNQAYAQDISKVKSYMMGKNKKLWPSLAEELAVAVVRASYKYGVPLDIFVATRMVESEANPFAVSNTGAAGLGQMDFSAFTEEYPVKHEYQKYDPTYNSECTAHLLSSLIRKHGLKKALALYNIGEGNYRKGVRTNYVAKVFAEASAFRYANED